MKKIALIAAAALVVLAGCKTKQTDEEILAAFQADIETLMNDYRSSAEAVDADEALTDAQKEAKFDELQESVMAKMVETGRKVLAKNASNVEVAPKVVANIYSYMDDAELEALLAPLSDEVKATEAVSYILGNLETKKATAVGKKFVDFTVDHVSGVDKDGNPVYEKKSLSDFVGKGKVMLVDFWSPWCPPCKAEIPNIKAVYDKYAGEDFDVLSVAVWDKPADTARAAAELGITWNQIVNAQEIPTDLYGIEGIPHIILIGPDGIILNRDLRGEEIEANVSRHVKAKK